MSGVMEAFLLLGALELILIALAILITYLERED
jgi:hypothetical protein